MNEEQLSLLAGSLLSGLIPGGLLDAVKHAPQSMSVIGRGLEPRVADKIDLISRSKEVRLIMRMARNAGVPYSVARERWSDPDDIAMEIAYDAIDAAEQIAKCPSCGVDPAEVLDPDTLRELEHGLWKLYETDCWFCGELNRANDDIDESERKRGRMIVIRPRAPGEPFRDFFQG